MRLTPANARDAKPGDVLKDHEVTGLSLNCNAQKKAWELYYRTRSGDQRRPTIGHFPEMTLSRAREVARALKDRVALGEDPKADWRARKEAPTVAELAEHYHRDHVLIENAPAWAYTVRKLLDRHILPGLGRMRIEDVRAADVARFLADVRARKYHPAKTKRSKGEAPGAVNNVRAILSKMFRFAEVQGWVAYDYGPRPKFPNPIAPNKRATRVKRKVVADAETLRAIVAELRRLEVRHPADTATGLRLRRQVACIWTIFLTGARVGEVRKATVAELEAAGLVKRDHKTVRHVGDKLVAVPRRAREIIDALPRCESGLVFGEISLVKTWRRIRKNIGRPELRLQDARRSWASFARKIGVTTDQVADVFGHTDLKMTHENYTFMENAAKIDVAERVAGAMLAAIGEAPMAKPRPKLRRVRWLRQRAGGEACKRYLPAAFVSTAP